MAESPRVPVVREGLLRWNKLSSLYSWLGTSGQRKTHVQVCCQQLWGELGSGKDIHSFIHSFVGASIQDSLSIHHVLDFVLGTENAAKHTRHTKIPAYILVGKGRQ